MACTKRYTICGLKTSLLRLYGVSSSLNRMPSNVLLYVNQKIIKFSIGRHQNYSTSMAQIKASETVMKRSIREQTRTDFIVELTIPIYMVE